VVRDEFKSRQSRCGYYEVQRRRIPSRKPSSGAAESRKYLSPGHDRMSASRFRWRRDFANRSNAATLALTITIPCTVAATDENKVNIYCRRRGGWETAVLYTATRDRTTPIPSSRARQEMRDRSIGFSSLVPAASQLLELFSHVCTYVRCSTRAFCCVYVYRRIVHRELSFSRIVEYILLRLCIARAYSQAR